MTTMNLYLDGAAVDPDLIRRALRARERTWTRTPDRLWYADPTGDAAVRNLSSGHSRRRSLDSPDSGDVDLLPLIRRLQRSLARL